MNRPELPEEWDRGIVVHLLLPVVLAALLVGGMALMANALVLDTDQEREGMPYASFQFDERNETIPHEGDINRTTLKIEKQSGLDLDQENVVVTVNGERAWTVSELDNGSARIDPVWSSGGDPVAGSSARIAVYGESLDGTVIRAADRDSADADEDDRAATYRYLQDGDVVQIVWRSDNGAKRTVLQRYVVGERSDDTE